MSNQYMKLIESRHRLMGFNMAYRDTQSKVQSKQKAGHAKANIVARGSI